MRSALRTLPLLAAALLAASPSDVRASDPLPVWGEFSREELFALHFPEAPDADAVILSDHGVIRVDGKLSLRTRRHRRTKIFTAAGAERHRTVRIPYSRDEKIQEFRAQTVVPPQRFVKADRSDESTADGNRVCVITFADVAPGTIVELSYETWNPSITRIEPWVFQNDDPTRVSRVDLRLPAGMAYLSSFNWLPGAEPRPETAVVLDPEKMERELQQSTWVQRDIPAFRPEAPLSSEADYRRMVYLQLTAYAHAGAMSEIAPDWDQSSGRIAATWAQARADAQGVTAWLGAATGATAGETARALHRRVRDGIAETGSGSPLHPAPLGRTVTAKRGTAADKNLLLLHGLDAAGVPARGILVRPRSEGSFIATWRVPEQFSAMIVEATLDGKPVLLDASAGCPFGALSPELAVAEGLRVGAEDGGIVPLASAGAASARVAGTRARLEPNGDLVARTRWTLSGHDAAAAGMAAASGALESFVRETLATAFAGATVSDASATEAEDGTVVLDASLRVAGWADVDDSGLTFRVPCLFAAGANPVPASGRTFPLEFPFPSTMDETLELRLPPGFLFSGSHTGARAAAAGLSYLNAPEAASDILKVRRRFAIRDAEIPADRYDQVGTFYRAVLEQDARTVVAPPAPSLADGERR